MKIYVSQNHNAVIQGYRVRTSAIGSSQETCSGPGRVSFKTATRRWKISRSSGLNNSQMMTRPTGKPVKMAPSMAGGHKHVFASQLSIYITTRVVRAARRRVSMMARCSAVRILAGILTKNNRHRRGSSRKHCGGVIPRGG